MNLKKRNKANAADSNIIQIITLYLYYIKVSLYYDRKTFKYLFEIKNIIITDKVSSKYTFEPLLFEMVLKIMVCYRC